MYYTYPLITLWNRRKGNVWAKRLRVLTAGHKLQVSLPRCKNNFEEKPYLYLENYECPKFEADIQ
jgi:hypothetical protein